MPEEVFSFSTLKDIRNFTNDMRVDFIGIVVSIGDPDEINLKSGRQKPVRRMIMADNSEGTGLSI